jgi:hypothetical protein
MNHFKKQRKRSYYILILLTITSVLTRAQDIQPYKAQDIQPYKSQDVQPVKSQDVQPVKSSDIQPYQSQTVRSNRSQEARQQKPRKTNSLNMARVRSAGSSEVKSSEEQQQPAPVQYTNKDLQSYYGLYQYWVPGTSYTVPDYTNQQLVIYNSSGTGVLPGGISISGDNKYVWNSSWDGKVIKGTWRITNDTGYPIELLSAQEGKSWRIGRAPDKSADIIIWDGSTWYYGKKIKPGK